MGDCDEEDVKKVLKEWEGIYNYPLCLLLKHNLLRCHHLHSSLSTWVINQVGSVVLSELKSCSG